MKDRIETLITQCEALKLTTAREGYMQAIIDLLGEFKGNLHASKQVRYQLSSGLGKIVLDDYAFAKSELGGEILVLCDEFAN